MSNRPLVEDEIEEYLLFEPIPSGGESEDELEKEDDTEMGESTFTDVPVIDVNMIASLEHDYCTDSTPNINEYEPILVNFTVPSEEMVELNADLTLAETTIRQGSTIDDDLSKADTENRPNETEDNDRSILLQPSTSRGNKRKATRLTKSKKKKDKPVKFGPEERPAPKWDRKEDIIPTPSGVTIGLVGVSENIISMDDPSPKNLFETMISDDMIRDIVFQTNLYAQQSGKRYIPTNVKEIKAFLGINILMGIKRLPSYRDYWSSEIDLNDPFISRVMPVNRFSWLLGNLHLNDNSVMPLRGDEKYDKLYKLRPFLDSIGKNFEENFKPGQVLAVDESMIKFKGRSTLKQYLPKKPIKRGYKLWMMADKSGYVVKFEVYTGKVAGGRQYDLGPSVVRRITESLQNKHHNVYIDNYFVSVFLMEDLKDLGINACGTINVDRKHLPKFKETKDMTRGEYDWYISDKGVSAVKWIDNKPVHMVSNFHDPRESSVVKRKQPDGERINVTCPVAISEYNLHMNCVDKFDQRKAAYEISRKSRKWWHRIFFYFVDAAVVNAFAIHNCLPVERLDLKTFRRQIVFGLVGNQFVSQANCSPGPNPKLQIVRSKPNVPVEIRRSGSSHQPKRGTRRRCALCSTKKKQVSTFWMCSICSVPLCLSKSKDCFQKYHSKQ